MSVATHKTPPDDSVHDRAGLAVVDDKASHAALVVELERHRVLTSEQARLLRGPYAGLPADDWGEPPLSLREHTRFLFSTRLAGIAGDPAPDPQSP